MKSPGFSAQQLGWVNWHDVSFTGARSHESIKTLGEMADMFLHGKTHPIDAAAVLYRVQWVEPDSGEGSLLFGSTVLEPGRVGDEYFMTHGHFHRRRDRGEFYATVAGQGALLLMDEGRRTWMEVMTPGSLHFIPGSLAHRVANTGAIPLRFVACWPADAGHDYASIKAGGFGARLRCRNGEPALAGEER